MVDFVYTTALERIGKDIDLENDDIRVLIVMSDTSVADEAERDVTALDEFTVLDEYDGSGYDRQALSAKSMSADTTNDRGVFTSDPVVFSALGVGARVGQALLFYKHVSGDDGDNIPIFYKAPAGFPFTGVGEDVTVNPHANGWAYLRNNA